MESMKISHLDFKLIDPLSVGEEWAKGNKNPRSVVLIYIDEFMDLNG